MLFLNDTDTVPQRRGDVEGIFILRWLYLSKQPVARDKPADTGDCELSVMAARTYL